MIPTMILILWLASIVLSVYVGKHAIRWAVKLFLAKSMIESPETRYDEGWNDALQHLDATLISREWVKPVRTRGSI